jgi:predicted chitinase
VLSGQTIPADARGLYAYKAELTAAGAEPDRQDAVYVLPTPAPIKAGDLIGYLGHYQRFADLKPLAATGPAQNGVRPLVQLDVFTAEDLKTFIAKSRERAKLLDAKQKTLLKIDVGAKLVLPSEPDQQIGAEEAAAVVPGGKDGAWVQVRKGTLQIMDKGSLSGFNSTTHAYGGGQILHRVLGASDSDSITEAAYNALKTKEEKDKYPRRQVVVPSGPPVWVDKALMGADTSVAGRSLKAWSTFPLQASQANGPEAGFIRVAAIKKLKKVATEPDGTRWWEVDVGKIDGSSGVGWAREKDHAKVTLCSPWDWPGFEFIEADGTTPEALYARHVVATKQAKPDEQAALEAKAQAATGGPLFSRVCDAIDLDDDRHLTPAELRKALKQPWLAEAISRLVFHHISEWGTPRAQWNAIDGDIPESRKADWEKEKNRIESLQWWSDVKTTPALPGDAKVYAFHPIGIINNFNRENNQLITLEMLRAANPTGDESYHELIIPILNEYAPVYGINTSLRIAHFLAQTGHESGFKIREENGNYSATRMRQIFGCKGGQKNYVTATDSCKIGKLRDKLWTDESAYANNAKNLLSYVYANRMGNGDEASQDGYTYRGRGLIQLTGKAMYRNYMNYHNNALPADQKDFISSPDLISSELRYGVESAFWYCNANNFSAAADADDLTKTTIIVNGGENGMPDRRTRLNSLKNIMGIN